jgi:hypothetical protein
MRLIFQFICCFCTFLFFSSRFCGAAVVFTHYQILPGTNLVGFPLKSQQEVPLVFQSAPPGTLICKWDNGSFVTNEFTGFNWTLANETVDFGEAVFVVNPGPVFGITFSGELVTGRIETEVPEGISLHGNKFFKSGKITTDFGLQPSPFDNVFLWNGDQFEVYTYLPGGTWHPSEPSLSIGSGFFIHSSQPIIWAHEFEP